MHRLAHALYASCFAALFVACAGSALSPRRSVDAERARGAATCTPLPAPGGPVVLPQVLHDGPANSVAFSADGSLLVTTDDTPSVRLWDAKTGELRAQLQADKVRIRLATIGPVTPILATASDDANVRLWDLRSGSSRLLSEEAGKIQGLAFSPDEQMLALASVGALKLLRRDGSVVATAEGNWSGVVFGRGAVYAWQRRKAGGGLSAFDANTGSLLWNAPGGDLGESNQVALSKDSGTVAWSKRDGNLYLSDARTGAVQRTLALGDDALFVGFSSDGTRLVTGLSKEAIVFDYPSLAERSRLPAVSSDLLRIGPSGKLLECLDRTVKVVDLATGHELRTLSVWAYAWPTNVALGRDGKTLAMLVGDGDALVLWDSASDTTRTFAPKQQAVRNVVWSPDGQSFATTSDGGDQNSIVPIWNARSGALLRVLDDTRGASTRFETIAWSPRGDLIALGTTRFVTLWNAQTGEKRLTLKHDDERQVFGPRLLTFARDGRTIAIAAGSEGKIRLWDTETGRLIRVLQSLVDARGIAYSPDGTTLAVTGLRAIDLFDSATGDLKRTIQGGAFADTISWLPDSSAVVALTRAGDLEAFASSSDQPLWHFEVTGGAEPPFGGGQLSVAVSADGKLAVVSEFHNGLRVWDLATHALLASWTNALGPVYSVAWNPRARVFAAARGIVQLTRPRDDTTLLLRTPVGPGGQAAVAYTPEGLFSGDSAAFDVLRFRQGADVTTAPILRAGDVSKRLFRPNLLAELLGGCPLKR